MPHVFVFKVEVFKLAIGTTDVVPPIFKIASCGLWARLYLSKVAFLFTTRRFQINEIVLCSGAHLVWLLVLSDSSCYFPYIFVDDIIVILKNPWRHRKGGQKLTINICFSRRIFEDGNFSSIPKSPIVLVWSNGVHTFWTSGNHEPLINKVFPTKVKTFVILHFWVIWHVLSPWWFCLVLRCMVLPLVVSFNCC